jgi:O-6-methylguanine DNA methyltransferase
VTTYKDIAHLLGVRAYRAVGQALRRNRSLVVIPCHRVVRSDGSLGGYVGEEDSARKAVLLRKEGIVIENGRIKDLEKVRYRFRGP